MKVQVCTPHKKGSLTGLTDPFVSDLHPSLPSTVVTGLVNLRPLPFLGRLFNEAQTDGKRR